MLTVLSIITGIILGLLGGPAVMVVFWGMAGVIIGFFTKTKNKTILNGFLYGFFLLFFFMIQGYKGSVPIIHRFMPFAVLGIVGGLCGIISSLAGLLVQNFLPKKRKN